MLTSVTRDKLFTRLLEGKKVISYNRLVEEKEKLLKLIFEINNKSITKDEVGFLEVITEEQRDKILMTSDRLDLEQLVVKDGYSIWVKRTDYNALKEKFRLEKPIYSSSQIGGISRYINEFICLNFEKEIPEFTISNIATHESLEELQKRLGEGLFGVFLKALKEYIAILNETIGFLLMIDKLTTSENVTMSVISKKFPELYEVYKEKPSYNDDNE